MVNKPHFSVGQAQSPEVLSRRPIYGAGISFFVTASLALAIGRFVLDQDRAGVVGPEIAWTLLAAGLLVSLLSCLLTWQILTVRHALARQAAASAEALQRTEERWSLAMEGLGGGVTDWNPQTGATVYSRRWREMLGLSEDEVGDTPDEWMSRVHPDDMPLLREKMQALFEGQVSSAMNEFRMRNKQGGWRWIRGHALIAQRDAAGMPVRLIGTNIDITERKAAEITRDALIDAHADAGIGLYATCNGRLIFANEAFAAISGYALDELMALPDVAMLVHPADRGRAERIHAERLAGDLHTTRYELGMLTKRGERREVENAVTYVRNNDAFDVLGIVTDITERKQAEITRDLLLAAHAEVGVGLMALKQQRLVFGNQALAEISGYTLGELRSMDNLLTRLAHPDDLEAVMATHAKRLAGERVARRYELAILAKDGQRRDLEVAATFTPESDRFEVIAILLDITERKQLARRLQEGHDMLSKFSRQLPGVMFQCRLFPDGHIAYPFVSENIAERYGVTAEQLKANPLLLAGFQHPGDREAVAHGFLASAASMTTWRNEYRIVRPGRATQWLHTEANPERLEDGSILWHGFSSDVTERKRMEEALREAAMVYENSSEAMSVTGADGRIITVNPAFTSVTGYEAEEIVGKPVSILAADRTFIAAIRDQLDTRGHWHGEVANRRKDGDIYPAALTVNTIFDSQGRPYRYVALFSDITNRKQTEELIWRQANFDALTHLPNRSMFYERVGQEIRKAHRSGNRLALLFIDLDHFKEVNDTLGHDTGDHLLLEAARRLIACVRETDAVARLGGDEFTMLLCEIAPGDTGIVDRIAREVLEALVDPFRLGDEEVYVSASVGITFYPGDAEDIEGLFRNADQAMYLSKSQGRNRYSYFTPELQAQAQNRLRLVTDLRMALANRELQVWFQPIVELTSGRIVKAEALLRWRHPQSGMVPPSVFIPLAEETGMIHEIGDWVFREAASWVRRWHRAGRTDFQISVNKSPVQFHKNAAGHLDWLAFLGTLDMPGNSISIEITEGLLLNADPSIAAALLGCRDAGIQVAIDDFGTGYSSLAYLNKFDIDYLKIDQSFISNLAVGSDELVLSEAIIVMAHRLGLKVIAEGVETQMQHELLRDIGCDYVQGFHIAQPLPPEAFEEMLFAGTPPRL